MSSIDKVYLHGEDAYDFGQYLTYYLQRLNALSDTDIRDFITVNSSDVMKDVYVSDTKGYPEMVTTFPEEVDALLWEHPIVKDRLREQYGDDIPESLGVVSTPHYKELTIDTNHCRVVKGMQNRDKNKWYIEYGKLWKPVGMVYGKTHYSLQDIHSAKEAIDIVETEYYIWLMAELERLDG